MNKEKLKELYIALIAATKDGRIKWEKTPEYECSFTSVSLGLTKDGKLMASPSYLYGRLIDIILSAEDVSKLRDANHLDSKLDLVVAKMLSELEKI